MALHKIVNGEKIDLTPEEEKLVKEKWAKSDKEKALKKEMEEKKLQLKYQALKKLFSNLSEEEAAILMEHIS